MGAGRSDRTRRPRSQDCPRGGPHAGPGSPGDGGSGAGAPADGGPGPPAPHRGGHRGGRPLPLPDAVRRGRFGVDAPRAPTRGRETERHRRPDPARATDLRPAAARSPGPRRGSAARFQPRPDRPSPQSQSFSRSYGSGLPTSLTYIVLSTRGCSPWRPAAVMGTTRGDGPRTPPHFQGPAGARRTPPETRRSTGPQPLAPDKPIPGIPPLTKKRKLFPGPRPASAGSLALQLGPPRRRRAPPPGSGILTRFPFARGARPPLTRRGAPASARSGTSLGLRID